MCTRRLFELGGAIAVSLLVAGSALAQLPKEDQKCIDQYNNKLRLVSATAGKDYRKCIKDAGKGAPNAENCLDTDAPGKIAGKAAKVTALYGDKCTGAEVIQQGAATGNAAHTAGPLDLTHDLLGDPVNDATVVSVDKPTAKCQDKLVQRGGQAFTEIIKAQRSCKKNAMKAGTVIDTTTLDATCGTFAQIDAGGKAAAKLAKLASDVGAACTGLTIGSVAPGVCSGAGTANALGICAGVRTKCNACLTLNAADGQSMDCDLFDDGAANSSCFIPGPPIGSHICTLGAGSQIALGTQALPLTLNPTGTVQIACGGTSPAGKAPCACNVQSFGVLVIPSIGDVCINPASCPAGEIDCDGGNAENVDLVADHNIGACTDDATCGSACTAFCGGLGAAYSRLSYGCEGFCQGGTNNNNACTMDSDCAGGACTGAEPPAHAGVCNCTCQGEGLGGAAAAGSLSCQVGTQIDVELPSNGLCDQAMPTIQLAPVCGAVTTATAVGLVQDANNTPAKTIPPIGGVGVAPDVKVGTATSCATMSTSTLTGLKLVGHLGFFDSTLGDIFSTNTFICQ
jgi:hypothetical protein